MMSINYCHSRNFISSKNSFKRKLWVSCGLALSIFCLLGSPANAEEFEVLLENKSNAEAQQLVEQYLDQLGPARPQIFVNNGKVIVSGSAKQVRDFNYYWRFANQGQHYILSVSERRPKRLLNPKIDQSKLSTGRGLKPRRGVDTVRIELGKPVHYRSGRAIDGLKLWQGDLPKLPVNSVLEYRAIPNSTTLTLELLFLPQDSNLQLGYRFKANNSQPPSQSLKASHYFKDGLSSTSALTNESQGILEVGRWYALATLWGEAPSKLKTSHSFSATDRSIHALPSRKSLYLRVDPIKSD